MNENRTKSENERENIYEQKRKGEEIIVVTASGRRAMKKLCRVREMKKNFELRLMMRWHAIMMKKARGQNPCVGRSQPFFLKLFASILFK